MAKRSVQCAHCSHSFEIDDDFTGESLSCPACKALVALPPSANDDLTPRQRLALKKDETISGSMKRCPLCDSSVPQESVICLTCGYDWRTGRQQQVGFRPSGFPLSRILLVAAVAAAVGIAAYVYLRMKPAPTALPHPSEAPAVTAEPAPTYAGPGETTPPPTEQERAAAEAEVAREAQMEADAAEFRAEMTRMLDARAPPYERNSPVAFRKTNGIIQRGTYLGVKEDVAILMQEQEMIEIALAELDRETRIRCDQVYRERYIEFLVQKRLRQTTGAAAQQGF
ncbi:MAG: hypothetical protein JXB04_03000 [Kiritimatiellae bacterium]|nr:hypothetical protein [Kiritimatiellia bacterium]